MHMEFEPASSPSHPGPGQLCGVWGAGGGGGHQRPGSFHVLPFVFLFVLSKNSLIEPTL